MGTKSAWTPERRARQSQIAKATRPWEHSTGPRSPEGKSIASMNALRSPEIIELRSRLSEARAGACALFCRARMPKAIATVYRFRTGAVRDRRLK